MSYNFEESIKNGTLHHAFIIEGPFNVDKVAYAKGIAKKILCKNAENKGQDNCVLCRKIDDDNHMDVFVVEATSEKGRKVKSIKNEQIEQLQERLMKTPFEGDRNIAIVKDADTITSRAFNRLLKTIEEPTEGTVIILLSENIKQLPQTIRSRCIHIRMTGDAASEDMTKGIPEARELIMLLIDGDYFYKEKQLVETFAKDREQAYVLLDAMETVYRDILFGKDEEYKRFTKEYVFKGIKFIEEARQEIRRNVSVMYALKKMILNIGG